LPFDNCKQSVQHNKAPTTPLLSLAKEGPDCSEMINDYADNVQAKAYQEDGRLSDLRPTLVCNDF
jgi:hypothetical protein